MARQRVIYSVFIYRGEDFPRTDFGIMASLQKALTKKDVAFVDAFVQVSFVGHSVRAYLYSNVQKYCSIWQVM